MAGDLADYGCKTAAAQPLLQGPERVLHPPGAHQDEPLRLQAERAQARAIKASRLLLLTGDTDPQHRAGETRAKRRRQARQRRPVRCPGGTEFVQTSAQQPSLQPAVQRGDAKGQARLVGRRHDLSVLPQAGGQTRKSGDLVAKGIEPFRRLESRSHDLSSLRLVRMFPICSH